MNDFTYLRLSLNQLKVKKNNIITNLCSEGNRYNY